MNKDHKEPRQTSRYVGHDPIHTAWTQSSIFNTAWLKNGESLNVLQRAGYTLFSLLFVAFGLYASRFAVMFAREGDFMVVIFGPVSIGFLVFGALGLRNVLRFKRG